MAQQREARRTQAIDPYLAGDKLADIGRQRVCSQRWLSTWRHRYDAPHPAWAQERSKRPKSPPTHTLERLAQAVVSLSLTVRHDGTGDGVAAITQALPQHGGEPVPSRRTLYRL